MEKSFAERLADFVNERVVEIATMDQLGDRHEAREQLEAVLTDAATQVRIHGKIVRPLEAE